MDNKQLARQRRHRRVRRKVSGTASRPRLSVFRSLGNVYAQLVDDEAGQTILTVSTLSKELDGRSGGNLEAAKMAGKLLAGKCREKKIGQVVFDRGGYPYQGRVRALAEGVREGGLKF
ncbi:50S ribosomal protein L18 [bacterium]|nr:50S ribosomal protein L18 [bacterium]MCK4326775.1 50S ribosomal protein L18 [bacterium]MCK4436836.1 50S ribosomal protein L18 [bacterium]